MRQPLLIVLWSFLQLSVDAASVHRVAGVSVRRIHTGGSLPWIYEADWANTAADASRKRHDPLSSCYWPAAAPLASLLSSHVHRGACYLELGCGTGLLSLTSAMYGAGRVIATDVSTASLELTDAAAAAQGLESVETRLFDVTDRNVALPRADFMLLSDLFVTDELAKAYAARVAEACASADSFRQIFVVDPGRSTRQTFLDALGAYPHCAHGGFAAADECTARALRGERLILLDTRDGEPVDYAI